MATTWRDDDDEAVDWDLEDALARAILGDVGELRVATTTSSTAPLTLRDEAEEERLIERLHARLFHAKPASASRKVSHATSRPFKLKDGHEALKPSPLQAAKVAPAQPRRSISPEKIDQMVARFRLQEAKRSRKLAALKHQTLSRSVVSTSPSDFVTPRSRELTRSLPGFQDRLEIAQVARERELERRRQHHERQQIQAQDSLTQAIRTPCICEGGWSGESHSVACVRFMDACERVNATSEIQHKTQTMRRTVDDLLQFHEHAKCKQQAMAETQRRMLDQETTFAPRINKNSIKIYEDMVQSGRREHETPARSPPPPWQPPLCAKSKLVLTTARRRSSITSRSSAGSKGSVWTTRRRPSHSLIPASFSESHWTKQAAAVAHKDSPPPSPQPPPLVVPWTTVTYEASNCNFILSAFDQPTWFR